MELLKVEFNFEGEKDDFDVRITGSSSWIYCSKDVYLAGGRAGSSAK